MRADARSNTDWDSAVRDFYEPVTPETRLKARPTEPDPRRDISEPLQPNLFSPNLVSV